MRYSRHFMGNALNERASSEQVATIRYFPDNSSICCRSSATLDKWLEASWCCFLEQRENFRGSSLRGFRQHPVRSAFVHSQGHSFRPAPRQAGPEKPYRRTSSRRPAHAAGNLWVATCARRPTRQQGWITARCVYSSGQGLA